MESVTLRVIKLHQKCGRAPNTQAALYMAAVVAIRVNPDIRAQQTGLLGRGKAKMSTLGAAMRKLVHLCFGVLKSKRDYQAAATAPA